MIRLSRWATAAAVAAGLTMSGLGAATAFAEGPSYQGGNCPPGQTCTHWCPGASLPPGSQVLSWDWNACHDWYWNSDGIVDVTTNTMYPWSGAPRPAAPPPVLAPAPPPPPPPGPRPFCSPRGSLFIIPPICDEIGY
ncbi:hypothetical protein [Mycolicibacterium lacusdiani]|uniref:hypothetical protein n=1 Tax=Mycolicibacterium lacusdiani TaxID=2895283 RepID=UPI001F255BFB|nr:hypothetical protein [Mycolicibacterium lacusdiani]